MRRINVLILSVCMLLSGCGVRVVLPGEQVDGGVTADFFDGHTTFFERYSSERNESVCKVKGTVHQSENDRNGVIARVTGQKEGGRVTVTGSMDCIEGSIKLVYVAADGTETIIAEDTERTIEAEIDVAEGEGTIGFAGDGAGAVCRFHFVLEAGEYASFDESTEVEEEPVEAESADIPEELEEPEEEDDFEILEDLEVPEPESTIGFAVEEIGLNEIEDNWPENISYKADGLYAQPLSVTFEVEEPMTLALKSETEDGKLRLKIIGRSGGKETVYYDETNPDGRYRVVIDTAGTCQALFYAEYHVGSVEITPLEEE